MDFFLNLLGAGGTIALIAFLLDAILRLFNKRGIFEDLGKMAKDTGTGLGKMLAGVIPGKKIEPSIDELLEHLQATGNLFIDMFQESLTEEPQNNNGGEKEND